MILLLLIAAEVLLLKCGSRLLSPSSGETWAGGWWRTQRQSRIPIGLSEDGFSSFVIVLSRFALNDAGRSMVVAMVARILEDPQLGDNPIKLSWTTTVKEVRFHYARTLGGVVQKYVIFF